MLAGLGLCLGLSAASVSPALAQDEASKIDKEAVAAVVAMSERLRALDNFMITADLTQEMVLESGEKLSIVEQIRAEIDRPTGIRMEKTSPSRERVFFFDGETATVWSPIAKFYAEAAFKGTNHDAVVALAEKFDVEIPLSDLFLWGTSEEDVTAIIEANYVGASEIGLRFCDHYAFRNEAFDWQIWIEKDDEGLPCRYEIIDKSDPALPKFQATVVIETEVSFGDRRFTFSKPDGSTQIPFAPVATVKE